MATAYEQQQVVFSLAHRHTKHGRIRQAADCLAAAAMDFFAGGEFVCGFEAVERLLTVLEAAGSGCGGGQACCLLYVLLADAAKVLAGRKQLAVETRCCFPDKLHAALAARWLPASPEVLSAWCRLLVQLPIQPPTAALAAKLVACFGRACVPEAGELACWLMAAAGGEQQLLAEVFLGFCCCKNIAVCRLLAERFELPVQLTCLLTVCQSGDAALWRAWLQAAQDEQQHWQLTDRQANEIAVSYFGIAARPQQQQAGLGQLLSSLLAGAK